MLTRASRVSCLVMVPSQSRTQCTGRRKDEWGLGGMVDVVRALDGTMRDIPLLLAMYEVRRAMWSKFNDTIIKYSG